MRRISTYLLVLAAFALVSASGAATAPTVSKKVPMKHHIPDKLCEHKMFKKSPKGVCRKCQGWDRKAGAGGSVKIVCRGYGEPVACPRGC